MLVVLVAYVLVGLAIAVILWSEQRPKRRRERATRRYLKELRGRRLGSLVRETRERESKRPVMGDFEP